MYTEQKLRRIIGEECWEVFKTRISSENFRPFQELEDMREDLGMALTKVKEETRLCNSGKNIMKLLASVTAINGPYYWVKQKTPYCGPLFFCRCFPYTKWCCLGKPCFDPFLTAVVSPPAEKVTRSRQGWKSWKRSPNEERRRSSLSWRCPHHESPGENGPLGCFFVFFWHSKRGNAMI